MATYSAPNYVPQLPGYESVVPLELMSKVGIYKQAKFDSNHQEIQDQLDKLGQLPIIKDSDREVIAGKMKGLVDKMNEFSGQDLGDSRVSSQLMGYATSFYNDQDIYERVADNQRAVSAMKNYQKMIEDDPDTYGANNAKLFLNSYNQWLTNPGKKFNASYTPYYNYTKEENDIIDRVRKDPNIFLKTLPDGSKTPYATEELKQVLPEKIMAALSSSLSGNALKQYQIDYEGSKDRYTVEGAVSDLSEQVSYLINSKSDIVSRLGTMTKPEDRKAAEQKMEAIDKTVASIQRMRSDVMTSGDPSQYYTFDSFLNKRLKGLGEAYSFEQHGDLKYDPYQLEMYKHRLDKDLEAFKAKLKGETDGPQATTLENTIYHIGLNKKGYMTPEEMVHVFGGSTKLYDDGSFNLPTHNTEVFLDMQPSLKSRGMDVDARKAAGASKATADYKAWTETPAGYNVVSKGGWGNAASGGGETEHQAKSFSDFVKWSQATQIGTDKNGKPITQADKYKIDYGLDVSSSADMSVADKIAADPDLMNAYRKVTKSLQEQGLAGNLKVVPTSGTNTVLTSGNNMKGNVLVQATRDRFLKAFGEGQYLSPNTGFNKMLKEGIIRNTNEQDANGDDIYQMSMWVGSNTNLEQVHDNWTEKHVPKKDGIDVVASQRGHFNNTMMKLGAMQPFIEDPVTSIKFVKENVGRLAIQQADKDKVNSRLDMIASTLKRDLPDNDREYLITTAVRLANAKTIEDINKILSE